MTKFEKSRIFFMLCGMTMIIRANDDAELLFGLVFLVANGLMFIYLDNDRED